MQRLIKAGLLPESAGQATMAQVLINFADLRRLHGSALEQQWINDRCGQPGWLTGTGAEAEACDAEIVPVVVGSVDWAAVDAMAEEWITAYGLDGHRRPCGCTCGGCTCTPPARSPPGRNSNCAGPCWRWPPTPCPAPTASPPTCYHHQVCIHRLGWTLTLHPDGTTEARSPHGEILRSHGPPTTRAG